jgi:solute carrier family 12 sodium/potassium/chloride transporter 2
MDSTKDCSSAMVVDGTEEKEVEAALLGGAPDTPVKKVKAARFQVAQVDKEDKGGEEDGAQEDNPYREQDTVQFTHYAKSLRYYLTREALPSENNYRNLMSFGRNSEKGQRPTIEELRDEEGFNKPDQKGEEDLEGQKKGKVIKFGWIEGVYMRCLLNIWGVMLFLRLTWVMGQCGIVEGLLVMTLANVVTLITSVSMSAVCTNGQIKGGGIYFMISRALGPEFGGAIGLMFTLANSIAVSMYIIGFAESLLDMFQDYIVGWTGIVDADFANRINDVRIIGSITLVLILVLAFVGMDWVTRVQKGLLVLLMCSQVDFLIGAFLPKSDLEHAKGFTGFSIETGTSNVQPHYQGESFFSVFAVFFPAVTGIVAGANLSGDLKDPATAIPKGTLLAIASTYGTYVIYGVIVAFTYSPYGSGVAEEYSIWTNDSIPLEEKMLVPRWDDCSADATVLRNGSECRYGTLNDQQTMAVISVTGYLIYGGCFAATLSSAIASLVGAPRVLQALAKDKLYPKIEFFAPGFGANNDPLRGYILVFFISLGCVLIGELNMVSSLLSNFFVAAYALINFSVFHASITKSPGWRPAFKYYNPWVSLMGTVLCVAVMFMMDWVTALLTYVIVIVLYFYIYYRKPEANWGSSAQAQVFVSALKGVQNLTETQDHVKNYRPKVLVLTGNPAHRPPLVDFANLITKKLSLLICAHVITEPGSKHLALMRESTQAWLNDHKIKGFYTVTESGSWEEGAKACLTLAGIGKLAPNFVLIGFKSDWMRDLDGLNQYINVLHSAYDHALSIGILRVKNGLDFSEHILAEETVGGAEDRRGSGDTEEKKSEEEKDKPKQEGEEVEGEEKDNVGELQPVEIVPGRRQRTRTISRATYETHDGTPLDKEIIASIQQFQGEKKKGFIDVWWLYDDGGLTLLIPYILSTRQMYSDCSLRVFTLGNKKDDLDRDTRNMCALLAKFRIDYSDVIVIPDVTKRAQDATKEELKQILDKLPEDCIPEDDLLMNKEKTNRHLRLAELLREHSKESQQIVMTLPMPRKGSVCPALYMAWLEIMTRDLPPTLLVRGNQTSVLTFYS